MKKPKILIALFRMPYPATDGTRYKILHNLIEGLVPAFEVEFLIATIDPATREQVDYMERHFGTVHLFRRSMIQFVLGAVSAFFSGLPFQVAGWTDRRATRWVASHIADYDAVYVHEIRMTEYFIHLSDAEKRKCIVDFNDAISHHYAFGSGMMGFPKNIVYRIEGKRIERYESRVLHAFSHFNIASPKDRELLLQNANMLSDAAGAAAVDFSCIPHGVQIPAQQAPLERGDALFFMGQLDYAPNRDALTYIVSTLWGPIKKEIPTATFHIIGRGKQIETGDPSIRFHGYVPDPFSVIQNVSALVAPIRYGAGVPSKIIEAMAYGLPVITTPLGIQGMTGVVPGDDILVCDERNIDEWVRLIKKLSDDAEYRTDLGRRARAAIQKNYASEQSQASFRTIFSRIVG